MPAMHFTTKKESQVKANLNWGLIIQFKIMLNLCAYFVTAVVDVAGMADPKLHKQRADN